MRIRGLSDDKEKNMHNRKIICGIIGIVCVVVVMILYYTSDNSKRDTVAINGATHMETTALQLTEPAKERLIYVYVCGCVNNPGVIGVKEGSRIVDVIAKAGGMTEEADTNALNQAEPVVDGQKVYVPIKGEKVSNSSSGQGKVNINTAGESELMTLPGIGESKAKAIISYRKESGGFKSIEDIMNIPGIKTSAFSKIKEYICV
jgi:competence protein ComEA